MNTRKQYNQDNQEHILCVLPFNSMSVSLYMVFLNSSGLEVCGNVYKDWARAHESISFLFKNIYIINLGGGGGCKWLELKNNDYFQDYCDSYFFIIIKKFPLYNIK